VACAAANPAGSYLLLGSGTFTVDAGLDLYSNNLTLRGSGPMSTILSITSGNEVSIGQAWGAGSGVLGSSYSAGTTSITLNSATGNAPGPGMVAWVTQCDTGSGAQPCSAVPVDNGGLFVCGDYTGCEVGTNTAAHYGHQAQNVWVSSVTNLGGGGYTFTITPGLYMPNWTTASGAMISWQNASRYAVGIGLEDLTVLSIANTVNYNVQIGQAYACWVKGVRFVGAGPSSALYLQHAKNNLVMSNYFTASPASDASYRYGLFMSGSSDVLILNNFSSGGLPAQFQGGTTGIVTAYNLGRDGFTPYAENMWAFDHHAFSSFNLWEANQDSAMTEDATWGTHALNTYFRNSSTCVDSPYVGGTPNARGININSWQRFENLIGNAIGSPQCTGYQGTGFGNAFQIQTTDALVASTMMRWGNVTVAQQSTDTPANSGVRFVSSEVPSSLPDPNSSFQNPVPSSTSLPASLFLPATARTNGGTGLSWWKVCTEWTSFPTTCASYQTQPFPTAGPDVGGGSYVNGHAHDIPAAVAWKTLPIDAYYQNSYSISSSSWSNGTMTLTFGSGVLPNVTHLMGGFQLSGVNAACRPSGGNSYTGRPDGEVLITNSSSTTVSYALPSDPGVSCTGTFLFPDVRQFDERAYQPDFADIIAPPTGLTATVK
jgi:hypothetical protein